MMRLAFKLSILTSILFAASSACAVQSSASSSAKPSSSGYHLLKKFELGGEGGWDYITFDPDGNRLFISRGTRVMVVDADSGKVTGEIPDTPGVHGIALAPELNRGFTSNGRENTVSIFDLKTLKVSDKVKVSPAENPDAILYEPSSKRVFTFNGRSKDATVIDAATGKALATVPIGGKPEFAVADEKGIVYVNDEDHAEVDVIDVKAMNVRSRWSLSSATSKCEEPTGLAIDAQHHRLFSTCDKTLVVMNSQDGHVIAALPTGGGTDAAAYDSSIGTILASNGEGTLTVIHQDSPDKYSLVENVITQRGARTMALDPKSHRVYLITAQFGPTPAATPENPRPRPPMVPNSFVVLVYGK